jgi:hypothetical protein
VVQASSFLVVQNIYLQKTSAENYFVLARANFTVPKIFRIQNVRQDLKPFKKLHMNCLMSQQKVLMEILYIFACGHCSAAFRISPRVVVRRNRAPSKFCVRYEMCLDIEVYDVGTLAGFLFKQPYYFHCRNCIKMKVDMLFIYKC